MHEVIRRLERDIAVSVSDMNKYLYLQSLGQLNKIGEAQKVVVDCPWVGLGVFLLILSLFDLKIINTFLREYCLKKLA